MLKNISKFYFVLIGIVLISGCNYENITKGLLKKKTPLGDDKFAQEYFGIVRSHNYKLALSLLDPKTRAVVQESDIENIASYIDSDEITSVELIGCKINQKNDKSIAGLTYQYQIGDNWFLVNVGVGNVNGKQVISGFQVTPIPKSLQELNALTITGKGVIHYLFLSLVLLVYVLTIYAFVFCIKSNIKMKWLWIFLLFTAVGQLSLNWTTGQILLNRFSLGCGFPTQTGFSRSLDVLYAPWIVNIKLPIGLIVLLIKGKILINNDAGKNELQG